MDGIDVKWLVDLNTDINQVQEATVEHKLFQYELCSDWDCWKLGFAMPRSQTPFGNVFFSETVFH